MSGPVSRTSRFWIVGVVMILVPLVSVGYRITFANQGLSLVEAVYHGLLVLAGIALADRDVARDLFARVTRLRHGRGPDAAA